MSVLVIAANSLRRLVRDRANLFFVFALPLLLILVLGVTVGGDDPRIGVYNEGEESAISQGLVEGLEQVDGARVAQFSDLQAATDELEREDVTALVIIPADFGDEIANERPAELEYLVIPGSGGFEVQSLVNSVIADLNTTLRAERVITEHTVLGSEAASDHVSSIAESIGSVQVVTVDPDGDDYVGANAVGFIAAQELILFVFLIGMIAASALIKSRQLGVTRRMIATPATVSQVVAGEALGRFLVAVVQSIFIIAATGLLFGLDWGSWSATAAIVVAFSLVATGAALFIGALVKNESQSSAIGISLGLAFAALGGCMVPFEVFPDWLRTAAHVTPHAWAVDAFTEVIQRDGGIGQIGVELAVLTLFGLALLGAASMALRSAIID